MMAEYLAVDPGSAAKWTLAVDFGGGSYNLAVDVRIRCQIRCQMNFGGGSSFLAVDLSIWRWIWRWIFLLAVDLAVDTPFSGGSKNPLPKFGGEDPLGTTERIRTTARGAPQAVGEAALAADLITACSLFFLLCAVRAMFRLFLQHTGKA